jgi:uroporphyrinogen-III synthase
MKIKRILVSQPKPESDKSPYFELAQKTNIKIDFKPFIQVEGVSCKDFRTQKVDILSHSAVVFTSKTAIDHFFRICGELRIIVPDIMKYFCISESIAYYLQKYIIYRKRKIFFGNGVINDIFEILGKHKDERLLVPLSDQHQNDVPDLLTKNGYKVTPVTLYKTVSSDMTDLPYVNYDVLVFFSPLGIKSLLHNFPEFKQNDIKIASFGAHTAKAVREAGLRLDIEAPMPDAPSMPVALEHYILEHNKNSK